MKTVYKYEIFIRDTFELELPEHADILSFQNQRGQAYIWALIDTSKPSTVRSFRLAGTGHPLGDNLEYIGSAQFDELVWHLFEMI